MDTEKLDTSKLTDNQKLFVARYSNMIGKILLAVEGAVPESPSDRQWFAVRKQLTNILYDSQATFLESFVK